MFDDSADDENGSIGKFVGFGSVTNHVKKSACSTFASLSDRYNASLYIY
jgi:hypothetical protein